MLVIVLPAYRGGAIGSSIASQPRAALRLRRANRVRTVVRRFPVLASFAVLAACGSAPPTPPGTPHDASAGSGADASGSVADAPVEPGADAANDASIPPLDAPIVDAAPTPDAFPAVLDVRIQCRNDCVLVANPASIAVPAGTSFEVNWINTGDTECDVAKIDPFNQVPIIIGLEPGTSYHDDVRAWCGMFTGTFQFRISICEIHSFIPVDCSR